ncbi:MAG: hypothetical protein B7W99_01415 [Rhodospirillales bacterium 20-58-10]|nr:MAG: hypothetical protein B7W99_01415 [Rhodospirillales bacterium 20-58-10]
MQATGNVLAVLGLSALAGGMLFFGAVMAPLIFTTLPPDAAGTLIRAAFPRYYGFMVVSATLAAIGFGLRGQIMAVVLLTFVVLATLFAWFWVIPYLNMLREAGNMAAFQRGHMLSTVLDGLELLAALWLLVKTALLIGSR